MTALYPFQQAAVDEIEAKIAEDHRKIILVAPTGSGKTVMAAAIIKRATERHRCILVLAHRREIIEQTSDKLARHAVTHGIIMAGAAPRPMASVQVASIDTLRARALRSQAMKLPPADLIIFDEAHHCRAGTYQKIIAAYPDAIVLGLTATPCRGDGRGLGNVFSTMIECPQVAELISQGYLVKSFCYAPTDPDLRGVRTVAGDYVESQLAERMDRAKLTGDIVTHWIKFGQRRRTVAFAVNVQHSMHLRDEFIRSGVRAEHLDGNTPIAERTAILFRLAAGETEVITNCMVLTEGFDCPDIGCIVLARPTKQMGLFRQMIGRGLRPANGKTDVVILDHSGAVYRHGLPEDHVTWTLGTDARAVAPAHQARLEHKVAGVIECTQCSALRLGGKPCPACGFLPQREAKYVSIRNGDLALVDAATRKANAPVYDRDTKRRWAGELTAVVREMGKNPGWAYHLFINKFHEKPEWAWKGLELPPSPEVRSYVRSRQIAYAKSRVAA
jgi:DNA repair protein RadD